MGRPIQEVKVFGIQDRRSTAKAKLPWIARISIDGKQRSKSFRTRAEADRYRSLLLQAVTAGERFDVETGEPVSWHAPLRDLLVHDWARRWLGEQWQEWQPRTRASAAEALARFVTLAVQPRAIPPTALRRYLELALLPDSEDARDSDLDTWLAKNCLSLCDLDRERIAEIDRRLGLKLDGTPVGGVRASALLTTAISSGWCRKGDYPGEPVGCSPPEPTISNHVQVVGGREPSLDAHIGPREKSAEAQSPG